MNGLFNAIVDLFQAICRSTGLSYEELNILVYCGLIPASWALLVCLRKRRWCWALVFHLLLMGWYLLSRKGLDAFSRQFYDVNTAALEQFGRTSGVGYVGVSLIVGVLVPIFIYGVLCFCPKRWVGAAYLVLIAGNLLYYRMVLAYN